MYLHGFASHPLRGFAYVRLHHAGFHRTFALAHHLCHGIAELARSLDDHGHATELHLGEFVVDDVLAEHVAVVRIIERSFVRGLHQAHCACRGLQTTVLEAFHLEVEALAESVVLADQMIGWYEPVLDRDLVRVHTAISDGVDGAALHLPSAILLEHESVRLAERFGNDEETQSPMRF